MARKRKKANGSAHTLPTDDQVRRGMYENYVGKIERAEARVKVVQKDVKDLYAQAKADKFKVREIKHGLRLKTEEGVESIRAEREEQERIERWAQIVVGTQAEMFDVSSVDRVYLDGERAAFSERPRKPPKELHVKDHPRWCAGYDNGRMILNASRAEKFRAKDSGTEETKTLGEAAADVVDSLAA
jgi:uncharacterized protein (UPF0335 family)